MDNFLPPRTFWVLTCVFRLISTVIGQCTNGYESTCVWSHDENAPLRWTTKSDGKDRWLELSGCQHPRCGSAIVQSPWLPPQDDETTVFLRYKIYGTSDVRLELSVKAENAGPSQLFFKRGNYAHKFPEHWTATKLIIPPIQSRYKLQLEANTPYKEAFVAVSDVNIEGAFEDSNPEPSEEEIGDNDVGIESPETAVEEEIPEEKDPNNEEEEQSVEESQKEDRFEALEANLFGDEDITKGYTRVVDPNICMLQ